MRKTNKDKNVGECRRMSVYTLTSPYLTTLPRITIKLVLDRIAILCRDLSIQIQGGRGPSALRYHRAAVNVVCDDVFVVLKVAVVEVALSVNVALAVGLILFLKMMIVVVLMLMQMLMLKFRWSLVKIL